MPASTRRYSGTVTERAFAVGSKSERVAVIELLSVMGRKRGRGSTPKRERK